MGRSPRHCGPGHGRVVAGDAAAHCDGKTRLIAEMVPCVRGIYFATEDTLDIHEFGSLMFV